MDRSYRVGVACGAIASSLIAWVGGCESFTSAAPDAADAASGPESDAEADGADGADGARPPCPAGATICETFDGELSKDWTTVGAATVTAEGAVSAPNALLASTESADAGASQVQGSLWRYGKATTTKSLVVEADVRLEAISNDTEAEILWLDRIDGNGWLQHGVYIAKAGLIPFASEGTIGTGPSSVATKRGVARAIPLMEYHHIRITSTETMADLFLIEVSVDNGPSSSVDYQTARSWMTKSVTVNLGIAAKNPQQPYRVRFDNFAFVAQ